MPTISSFWVSLPVATIPWIYQPVIVAGRGTLKNHFLPQSSFLEDKEDFPW